MSKEQRTTGQRESQCSLTALAFCVGVGLIWLSTASSDQKTDREAVKAQLREPITLGDGEQEVTVEEALQALAERTGWLIMLDQAVDLTQATVPAQHRSVWSCVWTIARTMKQEIDWPAEGKLLLLYPSSPDGALWGRIQHDSWQAANWVGWRRSLLDFVCSLTEPQRQSFLEPSHWQPWRDLSPAQRQLLRRELISPWDEEGLPWEALEGELQVFVGAQVMAEWGIGQYGPRVILRTTPGFPPDTAGEWRRPRRPLVPVELPGDDVVTVGELVDRIQAATGQEMYAEPELSEREVRFIGTSRSVSDQNLQGKLEQFTWGVWQRVENLNLLTVPWVSDLGWGEAMGKKEDLWRSYNEDLLAELRSWLAFGDLPVTPQPITKPFHRLGDLDPKLQAELIGSLKQGVDDLTKRAIGEQFLRADWLSDSKVRFSPYLAVGFLHPQHGRHWYGAGPL